MEGWYIAISQENDDGIPAFSSVRQLSDDQHRRLESVLLTLSDTLGRTTWHVLQQNYDAFRAIERDLSNRVDGPIASHSLQPEQIKIAVTTTIVNFLSSMHIYLEHTGRRLKHADKADEGSREASWEAARHAEFDDYFAYKFLYGLRNYVQHRELPIDALTIDHSLTDAAGIADRAMKGQPPLFEGSKTHDVTISISLRAAPSELLRDPKISKYLKQAMESLTTDIDLSEQIHVGMECLTRLESAFQEEFRPELSRCVAEYSEIVGELHAYESRPFLMRIDQEHPFITANICDLQPERFMLAKHLAADRAT